MTDRPLPRLLGVLVTFRRPEELTQTLRVLAGQTRPIDHLVVVDNDPTPRTREIVGAEAPEAEYLAAPENLGAAGGIVLGMERLLADARDDDVVLILDDDDPPPGDDVLELLWDFRAERMAAEPRVGAVGMIGVRFDHRRGRVVWVADDELRANRVIPVDAIGGGLIPLYTVAAIREVGLPRAELFFGFDDFELCLRIRAAGWSMYCLGPLFLRGRAHREELGLDLVPSRRLGPVSWRRYYSLRNLVWLLRDQGNLRAAIRVSVVTGFAKPLANVVSSPRLAWAHLRMNARAVRDGWTGRLGRTIEPAR
jgi:glycosyltransferase involved in cell wall biosynthesis